MPYTARHAYPSGNETGRQCPILYHEHIIRDESEFNRIREYVINLLPSIGIGVFCVVFLLLAYLKHQKMRRAENGEKSFHYARYTGNSRHSFPDIFQDSGQKKTYPFLNPKGIGRNDPSPPA